MRVDEYGTILLEWGRPEVLWARAGRPPHEGGGSEVLEVGLGDVGGEVLEVGWRGRFFIPVSLGTKPIWEARRRIGKFVALVLCLLGIPISSTVASGDRVIEADQPGEIRVVRLHPKIATAFHSSGNIVLGARGSVEVNLERSQDGRVVIATVRGCTASTGVVTNIVVYAGDDVYTFDAVCASSPEEATQVVRLGPPREASAIRRLYDFLQAGGRRPDGRACIDLGGSIRLCPPGTSASDCKAYAVIGGYVLCKK